MRLPPDRRRAASALGGEMPSLISFGFLVVISGNSEHVQHLLIVQLTCGIGIMPHRGLAGWGRALALGEPCGTTKNHNGGHSAGCGVAPGAEACPPEVLQCSEFLWAVSPCLFCLAVGFWAFSTIVSVSAARPQVVSLCRSNTALGVRPLRGLLQASGLVCSQSAERACARPLLL